LLRCGYVRTNEKGPGPGALIRRAPTADSGDVGLPEQAAVQRQAHGGRERAADPADEVKLNVTKRASASEKRQTLFLRFEP